MMEEPYDEYEIEPAQEVDVFSVSGRQELVDYDALSAQEEGFLRGYEEDL